MFTNFIYLIVVLLIYTTYQPSENTNFSFLESILLFIILSVLFSYYTYKRFKKIRNSITSNDIIYIGRKIDAALSHQSILAIILFTTDIYILNLPAFFNNLFPFTIAPTLLAILFLSIFISYLTIIWYFAYPSYQKITRSEFSRKSYINSNIRFSAPMLLPWLLLSGTVDIIQILPFDSPKIFLSTTYGQVSYFIVFLSIIAIFGPAIIQKFWQCKSLKNNSQRKRIEDLCKQANIGYSDILNWPILGGRMITAGVMGLVRKFRYILVTRALLHFLEQDEIDAVIAHEIGHVKKYHLFFYFIFFAGFLLFFFSSFNIFIILVLYLEPFISPFVISVINTTSTSSFLLTLFLIINLVIYFRFVFGYFMRNFERQADIFVYTLFNTSKPLISTFKKIAITSGQSPDKPNWHHFSIKERIDYLNKCEKDRTWIDRHDKKVRKSIIIFCFGLLCIGILGYMLNFGKTGRTLTTNFIETILSQELDKNPNNFNLYNSLGDINYQKNNFSKTIEFYEASLTISMENPHALNNLAWLYATCEETNYRNPKRALDLSLKAARLKTEPHILDTLAESYYVNGMFHEAVTTEIQAIELAKTDRSHYENQLKKFKEALVENNSDP